MNALTEAFREQRHAMLAQARTMTGDDCTALLLLDLVAQTKRAVTNARIRWCAGYRINCDPRDAGSDGLNAIWAEYTEGLDEGPEEKLSEAARFRKTHRPIWLEFQV